MDIRVDIYRYGARFGIFGFGSELQSRAAGHSVDALDFGVQDPQFQCQSFALYGCGSYRSFVYSGIRKVVVIEIVDERPPYVPSDIGAVSGVQHQRTRQVVFRQSRSQRIEGIEIGNGYRALFNLERGGISRSRPEQISDRLVFDGYRNEYARIVSQSRRQPDDSAFGEHFPRNDVGISVSVDVHRYDVIYFSRPESVGVICIAVVGSRSFVVPYRRQSRSAVAVQRRNDVVRSGLASGHGKGIVSRDIFGNVKAVREHRIVRRAVIGVDVQRHHHGVDGIQPTYLRVAVFARQRRIGEVYLGINFVIGGGNMQDDVIVIRAVALSQIDRYLLSALFDDLLSIERGHYPVVGGSCGVGNEYRISAALVEMQSYSGISRGFAGQRAEQ